MQTCANIMNSDVTWIPMEATVQEAAVLMRERDLGFLPICDSRRHVQGVLTDRDIDTRVVAKGASLQRKVMDSASTGLVTCEMNESVRKAQELMEANQVQRIVIVDKNQQLVGVLGLADLTKHAQKGSRHTANSVKQPRS